MEFYIYKILFYTLDLYRIKGKIKQNTFQIISYEIIFLYKLKYVICPNYSRLY